MLPLNIIAGAAACSKRMPARKASASLVPLSHVANIRIILMDADKDFIQRRVAISEICESDIARTYDEIYRVLLSSNVFTEALAAAMGEKGLDLLGQFSFATRDDVAAIIRLVRNDKHGRILDVGCGTGSITNKFSKRGKYVCGLDISHFAINGAHHFRSCARSENVSLIVGDFHRLPFKKESFSTIIGIDSLQNANSRESIAAELYRVAMPQGTLAFTTWTHFTSRQGSRCSDPLVSALEDVGFVISDVTDTDPGLNNQIKVYIEIGKRKERLIQEMGDEVFRTIVTEARHFAQRINKVRRLLIVLRKSQDQSRKK
ncbi:class I SAM-dependent methyltransferase [Caballeronia sordidicola]|uniref:class I SAM-dependent methyltransferase n=1 Tax=Caballeronia sordidicola TaxID=196367 RepID=UPI000A399CB1|nr:class I SAM-dependent methyltransferase [Caballeronia sordidicola]